MVSANLHKATHTGNMVNIGPVKARMVVTPDWKEMITSHKAEVKHTSEGKVFKSK